MEQMPNESNEKAQNVEKNIDELHKEMEQLRELLEANEASLKEVEAEFATQSEERKKELSAEMQEILEETILGRDLLHHYEKRLQAMINSSQTDLFE